MGRSTGDPRGRVLPRGLIGMAVLMLVVKCFIDRHRLDYTTLGAENYRFASRKSRHAPEYQVICLGDSLFKAGIAAPLIEARLGKPAYNFSIAGGLTPAAGAPSTAAPSPPSCWLTSPRCSCRGDPRTDCAGFPSWSPGPRPGTWPGPLGRRRYSPR